MLKEAIKYIASLAVEAEKPELVTIEGKTYCTKELDRYGKRDMAAPINGTTLTSLVDYIKECSNELHEKMIIHILNPATVVLCSGLLEERQRENLFIAKADIPYFGYGCEHEQEEFIIAMQSCFLKNGDNELVTKVASNIVNTQQHQYSDDGVTQQAVIKTGITSKDNAIVPNPVTLTPYRTFFEITQPESLFVFRIGERNGHPFFKLVEADGGAWKKLATERIRAYLKEQLKDKPEITVLA